MAMKKCKECNKEISSKAPQCPQCGAPQKRRIGLSTWLLIIVVLFMALSVPIGQDLIEAAKKRKAEREGTIAPTSQQSPKFYSEKDIFWDKETAPYKDVVIRGVNKVAKENKRCASLDPGTASKSTNKGTKKDPVFFVTCNTNQGEAFNVFFSKSDVEKGVALTEAKHVDSMTAIRACEQYAKTIANHPSTVDFSYFNAVTQDYPNGRTRVQSTFTAKNSFNLEEKFAVNCLFDSNGFIEGNVGEVR